MGKQRWLWLLWLPATGLTLLGLQACGKTILAPPGSTISITPATFSVSATSPTVSCGSGTFSGPQPFYISVYGPNGGGILPNIAIDVSVDYQVVSPATSSSAGSTSMYFTDGGTPYYLDLTDSTGTGDAGIKLLNLYWDPGCTYPNASLGVASGAITASASLY